jgi:hypothetical protein
MSEIEQDRYWVVPRDKPGLLVAMMRHLAGDSHISFEGNLSNCKFPPELSPSSEETTVLRRATSFPLQDFVVLPLTQDTIRPILDIVLPANRFMKDIIHIQIEKASKREFGSYDNFDPECIVCFLGVSVELLETLKQKGVIRSWTTPYKGAQRWHG